MSKVFFGASLLLFVGACASANAQGPLGGTPESNGANVTSATADDDAPRAAGPSPAAIDGPAPPTTDGMTPGTTKLPGNSPSHAAAAPVNSSGSADSAPNMGR